MPIYEYECKTCNHKFDLIQKMNDAPETQCPHCHKETAVRLISPAGFQLKGTGWYVTDFKDKDKPKKSTTSSDGSESQKSTSSDAAKTSTKKQGESD